MERHSSQTARGFANDANMNWEQYVTMRSPHLRLLYRTLWASYRFLIHHKVIRAFTFRDLGISRSVSQRVYLILTLESHLVILLPGVARSRSRSWLRCNYCLFWAHINFGIILNISSNSSDKFLHPLLGFYKVWIRIFPHGYDKTSLTYVSLETTDLARPSISVISQRVHTKYIGPFSPKPNGWVSTSFGCMAFYGISCTERKLI